MILEETLAQREEHNTLSSAEIAEILPHRYPFALVDRVMDFEPGAWAVGRKCVSVDEPFFQGHFPGQPIMPGVLIIEALAQTGAIAALSLEENKGKIVLFGGIKNARFKRPVVPGDVLDLRCQVIRQKGPVGVAEAEAIVDGKIVAKAEITFSIV
ncbi:MAG: 3-hydroxyacyl-ACP dehydratase FabZ [Lachnospiraceae bacterium]|nr:3-hydroxyacyl-ACP dehydratase FabZ [Lachnospiraceae bacterium]